MKIEDMVGKFIRYNSNTTKKDGNGCCWYGLVRKVDAEEIEINGCLHLTSSIEVLEILNINGD